MTTKEFSDSFDILINSYPTINEFGSTITPTNFNEYEKSVLLTKAQEQIVQGLFDGSLTGLSFEETENMRRDLDVLVKTSHPRRIEGYIGLSKSSTFYELEDDVWYITYESIDLSEGAYCENSNTIKVIPVRQDEWHNIKNNPFKKPNERRAIRLDAAGGVVEIISAFPVENYLIRYVRKPKPIILVQLEDGLSIDNTQEVTECELSNSLHQLILDRAVQLARNLRSKE